MKRTMTRTVLRIYTQKSDMYKNTCYQLTNFVHQRSCSAFSPFTRSNTADIVFAIIVRTKITCKNKNKRKFEIEKKKKEEEKSWSVNTCCKVSRHGLIYTTFADDVTFASR